MESVVNETISSVFAYITVALGALLAAWSGVLLVAAWFAPRILQARAFAPGMLGPFRRTRHNLTLLGGFGLSYGCYLSLTLLESLWVARMGLLGLSFVFGVPVVRLMRAGRNA